MKEREKGIELAFSVSSCQTDSLRLNITARLSQYTASVLSAACFGAQGVWGGAGKHPPCGRV